MTLVTLAALLCLSGPVLGSLKCSDWQGKTFSDGEKFNPKSDPCFTCYCEKGSYTMCNSKTCGSLPNCKLSRQIPGGKCCEMECLTPGYENTTRISTDDAPGSPTDSTMTDLGLRLVASTVTTFLILALLLFLIHRLRQRRLLIALRRYGHRREHFDDSDNMSYAPELYMQCPPYEDPPPPYSPPKPAIRPGEQPPPYEAIDSNNPNQSLNSWVQNQQSSLTNGGIVGNGVTGSVGATVVGHVGNSRNPEGNDLHGENSTANAENDRMCGNGNRICGVSSRSEVVECPSVTFINDDVGARNGSLAGNGRVRVHFRNRSYGNNGQMNITMGIQNRVRNNRNRFSDGCFVSPRRSFHAQAQNSALNLEVRNVLSGLANSGNNMHCQGRGGSRGDRSSSTTDIGESSTSAESLESSPNYSPDSPDIDSELPSPKRYFADDADIAVKQFLDRQFGPMSRGRRYPTTTAQAWSSSPPGNSGFRQSISLGSFLPNQEDRINGNDCRNADDLSLVTSNRSQAIEYPMSDKQLCRSKSEQLKTNGSLRNPPYKNIVRSQTAGLPQCGFAARVSYMEPDEISQTVNGRRVNVDRCSSPPNYSNIDSNISECSTDMSNSSPLVVRDPGDIMVSRRNDLLRDLRLSHLLQTPCRNSKVTSAEGDTPGVSQIRQNEDLESVDTELCSRSDEQNLTSVAISNDAQYPEHLYENGCSHTSCLPRPVADDKNDERSETDNVTSVDLRSAHENERNRGKMSIVQSTGGVRNAINTISSLSKKCKSRKNDELKGHGSDLMSQSWHGGQVDSCDENCAVWQPGTDTLGRNVNNSYEKKVCHDKDVSNLFLPHFKTFCAASSKGECDRSLVPNSNMRACASQLYNCETDEKIMKKDRRKHLHKRHSAGCLPPKKENEASNSQFSFQGLRLPQKLKSSNSKERRANQRLSESQAENMKRSVSKAASSHRKDFVLLDPSKIKEYRQRYNEPDLEPKVTDLTKPCVYQSKMSSGSVVAKQESTDSDDKRHSRRENCLGKGDSRRSKSLGRADVSRPSLLEKQLDCSPVRRAHGRRKKAQNRQSFPARSNLFQRELEHILESQKVAMNSSLQKSRQDGSLLCAMSQV